MFIYHQHVRGELGSRTRPTVKDQRGLCAHLNIPGSHSVLPPASSTRNIQERTFAESPTPATCLKCAAARRNTLASQSLWPCAASYAQIYHALWEFAEGASPQAHMAC